LRYEVFHNICRNLVVSEGPPNACFSRRRLRQNL
jgi:hypothetical protein